MKDKVIKILVASHKEYKFPDDKMYIPIHVGAEGKKDLGYLKDNTGKNISIKNPNYCELTALYWAYHNLEDYDYIGLNHYRRYFTNKSFLEKIKNKDKFKLILTKEEILNIFEDSDIIVSSKQKLITKNVYTKYKQQHYIKDLDKCGEIIEEMFPDYYDSFNKVMKSKKLSICNMFIMKKEDFIEYCDWVFPILFELEKDIDMENYSVLQKRVFGFLSERLFNVWLDKKQLKECNLPILSLEHDSFKTICKKSYKRIMKIKS